MSHVFILLSSLNVLRIPSAPYTTMPGYFQIMNGAAFVDVWLSTPPTPMFMLTIKLKSRFDSAASAEGKAVVVHSLTVWCSLVAEH